MGVLKTLTVNGVTYEVKPVVPASGVTLRASAWAGSEGAYSQVVTLTGVTPHTKVDLQPTPEQVTVFLAKTLAFVAENTNGVVTVYSIGDKPTEDYTIQVTMTEVDGTSPIRGNTVGLPNPQADWNQTDETKADFIKNKPHLGVNEVGVLSVNGVPPDENGNVELEFEGGGSVLTVNGVGPDENGNIEIAVTGGSGDITDEERDALLDALEEEV